MSSPELQRHRAALQRFPGMNELASASQLLYQHCPKPQTSFGCICFETACLPQHTHQKIHSVSSVQHPPPPTSIIWPSSPTTLSEPEGGQDTPGSVLKFRKDALSDFLTSYFLISPPPHEPFVDSVERNVGEHQLHPVESLPLLAINRVLLELWWILLACIEFRNVNVDLCST